MASILIVDDSSAMRTVIKRILAMSGFEMETCLYACDGEDALSTLRRQPVDLVISDINMPRMDGEALLREMSADSALSVIPVVMVSSDATESRAAKLLGARRQSLSCQAVSTTGVAREIRGSIGGCSCLT